MGIEDIFKNAMQNEMETNAYRIWVDEVIKMQAAGFSREEAVDMLKFMIGIQAASMKMKGEL